MKNNNLYADIKVVYLHKITVKSQLIYTITILSLILCMLSLPFIKIDISLKSDGIIQSREEKISLFSPVTGYLTKVEVSDNERVNRSAHLFTIDGTPQQQEQNFIDRQMDVLRTLIGDAQHLYQGKTPTGLKSELYRAGSRQYDIEVRKNDELIRVRQLNYDRYLLLYQKKVIALSEFEQYQLALQQSILDRELVIKKYRQEWQQAILQYKVQLRDLANQKVMGLIRKKDFVINAPITGSIQNLIGLKPGAMVYANQKLAEVSPDSGLLVYCYIGPSDIGLIRKGQEVRLQINAFNYNHWGFLTAKVADISNDVIAINNDIFFKIKCSLSKNYLQLQNGHKGMIKKGMTVRASFALAQRSLWQLLLDKSMNWAHANQA